MTAGGMMARFPLTGLIALWLAVLVAKAGSAQEPIFEDEGEDEEFSVYLAPSPLNLTEAEALMPRRPVVHAERARFPRVAAKKRTSGCVIYGFLLDAAGAVSEIYIVDSSNDMFNQVGKEALLKYRFMPLAGQGEAKAEEEANDEERGAEETADSSDDAWLQALAPPPVLNDDPEAETPPAPEPIEATQEPPSGPSERHRIQLVWRLYKTPLPDHPACKGVKKERF